MNKIVLLQIVTAILMLSIVGCTTTHVVQRGEELVITKVATLIMQDSTRIVVEDIVILGDSLTAKERDNQLKVYYHLDDIKSVLVKNRLKGAFQGSLITAVSTVAIAYPINEYTLNGDDQGWVPVFTAIAGGIGALLGPIPGALVGSKEYYTFESTVNEITALDSSSYIGK